MAAFQSRNIRRFGACVRILEMDLSNVAITKVADVVSLYRNQITPEVSRNVEVGEYKVQATAKCIFQRELQNGVDSREQYISVNAIPVDKYAFRFIDQCTQKLDQKIDIYQNLGSNFIIAKIHSITFHFLKHSNICRLSGHSYIPTPEAVAKSKAIVNVQNKNDVLCFLYSILAVLYYAKVGSGSRQRPQAYKKYLHTLRYKEKDMPMRLCDIPKFERTNSHLAINVFMYKPTKRKERLLEEHNDDDDDYSTLEHPFLETVYRTRNKKRTPNRTVVNLLLLQEQSCYHYCAITNLDRLINTQKKGLGVPRIQNFWCESCLLGFRKRTSFEKHLPLCEQLSNGFTTYTMPKKTALEFSDLHKTISPPYAVYADFESILSPETSQACQLEKHIPCAAGYLFVQAAESLMNPIKTQYRSFFGSDAIVQFLHALEEDCKRVAQWIELYAKQNMVPMTQAQEADFRCAKVCYMCQRVKNKLVRDHDHFTGRYMGPACVKCNMARRVKKTFLPVVFHNLRGYDMHHIIKYAAGEMNGWELFPIAQTSEKFLALIVHLQSSTVALRFIDSLQFLNSSLAKLVSNLEPHEMQFTSANTTIPDLIKSSKGIFPYSYAKDFRSLLMCESLPPKSAFFNILTQRVDVSDADYMQAQQAWVAAKCRNLCDYMMMYLKLDVHQLADVFQTFRKTAMSEDSLDPLHFFSIPGLSWSSAFKMRADQGEEAIDLLQDVEMYQFFEHGIRGGMTFINKHYTRADENTQLLYIDINNLYGWALSQRLPCSDFEWIVDHSKLSQLLENLPSMDTENAHIGYVMEVDLHIPEKWHDFLDQLPPAPISEIPNVQAAPKCSVKKLLLTLKDKTNYIVHFRLLQFYINYMGVEVTKVHRAIEFYQDYVFKTYIDYNSQRRSEATNAFAKDYYKLKNNSLYGKTVENIRKRTNVRLCQTQQRLVTYTSKPTFKRVIIISDNMIAAFALPELVVLNKPVYIGQSVLDISKLRMYELNYRELAEYRMRFQCELNIVAGDTDSFFIECKNIDLKSELLPAMIEDGYLDTSNYPKEDELYSSRLASRIGKFKDESGGQDYDEWVFLRPKSYSLLKRGDSGGHLRAKGVILRQTQLTHSDYKCEYEAYKTAVEAEKESMDISVPDDNNNNNHGVEYFDDSSLDMEYDVDTSTTTPTTTTTTPLYVTQRRIGSKVHQLYTFENQKLALNIHDDKRCWVSYNTSHAYGHYSLNDE